MDDNAMTQEYQKRFQAMSRLAVGAAAGEPVDHLLEQALHDAISLTGLVAGSVRIFGEVESDITRASAGDETAQRQLAELEKTLLSQLRHNYAVRSLFMTMDLDGPAALFSYPLKSGDVILGAIAGLARGERNLAVEEEFVATLAAMIVLIGRARGGWSTGAILDRESAVRTQAVLETAAAINHEINNPLMAVMGNVELLLRRGTQLDADAREKLQRIHDAATRIRHGTQNLMRIVDARSMPYPGGSSIIDIAGSPKREDNE